jgi:hypothetical protein
MWLAIIEEQPEHKFDDHGEIHMFTLDEDTYEEAEEHLIEALFGSWEKYEDTWCGGYDSKEGMYGEPFDQRYGQVRSVKLCKVEDVSEVLLDLRKKFRMRWDKHEAEQKMKHQQELEMEDRKIYERLKEKYG